MIFYLVLNSYGLGPFCGSQLSDIDLKCMEIFLLSLLRRNTLVICKHTEETVSEVRIRLSLLGASAHTFGQKQGCCLFSPL